MARHPFRTRRKSISMIGPGLTSLGDKGEIAVFNGWGGTSCGPSRGRRRSGSPPPQPIRATANASGMEKAASRRCPAGGYGMC